MFKKISSKLETMFDHNPPPPPSANRVNTKEFFISENNRTMENLSYIFSQENLDADGTRSLFLQLSNYFECGLLYRRGQSEQKYSLDSAFWGGVKIPVEQSSEKIKLPATALFSVLKTSARPFLARLDVAENPAEKRMTAYLIPLSPTFSLIAITCSREPRHPRPLPAS